MEIEEYVLDKSITTTATGVIFLKLGKLKLPKGLEDVLKILLSDTEVDIANIQTVEGDRIGVATRGTRFANLTILFSFG